MKSLLRFRFTFLLHIALVIILAGAIVTHYDGVQGTVTLTEGAAPVTSFDKTSGPGDGTFPFSVALSNFDIIHYPGTTTPMDFRSILQVDGKRVEVSMNNIGVIDGWRFYQSAISGNTSTLSVSHDPVGIAITYSGYLLLGISMIGFFFQRGTPWRSLMKKYRKYAAVLLLISTVSPAFADSPLPVMQRPLAANLGKVYVYWNDRVAPMQTMARGVTTSLYGSTTYQGLTSEQVLSGWLFYFDEWWRDYTLTNPEILSVDSRHVSDKQKKLAAKLSLIQWLGTGEAFRIYPYQSAAGNLEWLSLTGKRPSAMSLDQWKFMQTTMPDIKENLLKGKNIEANEIITHLILSQKKYAGDSALPSDGMIRLERLYNVWGKPLIPAVASFLLAVLFWCLPCVPTRSRVIVKRVGITLNVLAFLYVLALMAIIWILSGHIPLSNGPETMLFMGLVALCAPLLVRNDEIRGALLLIAGACLMVAMMGAKTPRIGALMPVLGSPLLSIHVMLVMISYVVFLLMTVLSATALISRNQTKKERLHTLNLILLTPAVFLLAAGIFIGAVWANQSWGRYWGWDPKETCALVMLLIYSVPLHWSTRWLRCFRKPKVLHLYLLFAVLSVLFTYFGANYLLPGLHSYA